MIRSRAMSNFDFDRIIERRGTDCLKYDYMTEHGRSEDTIPLFIADMDFASPEPIQQALHKAVDRRIYGYTSCKDDYFEIVASWFDRRYGWKVQKEWLLTTPGVVHALNICVRALSDPGDGVLILTPVYGPFGSAAKNNGRKVVESALIWTKDGYRIDWADFEVKAKQAKVFLLCSPHNPVGRVWTKEELIRMGEICSANGVKVVSDEIHADFIYDGCKHYNFAALSDELAKISVVCTSPGKTFNLAGLCHSNIFVPDAALREAVRSEMQRSNTAEPTIFAYVACKSAYTDCDDWLDKGLLPYLKANIEYARAFFADHFPTVRFADVEGTFLLWGDFSSLGEPEVLEEALRTGGVWLSRDSEFNVEAKGFYRINIATPRAVLKQALERIKTALERLK